MDDRYEIRIKGRLGPVLRSAFHGMRSETLPRHTLIRGRLSFDELHRLLERLNACGLVLVELDVRPPRPAPPTTTPAAGGLATAGPLTFTRPVLAGGAAAVSPPAGDRGPHDPRPSR